MMKHAYADNKMAFSMRAKRDAGCCWGCEIKIHRVSAHWGTHSKIVLTHYFSYIFKYYVQYILPTSRQFLRLGSSKFKIRRPVVKLKNMTIYIQDHVQIF